MSPTSLQKLRRFKKLFWGVLVSLIILSVFVLPQVSQAQGSSNPEAGMPSLETLSGGIFSGFASIISILLLVIDLTNYLVLVVMMMLLQTAGKFVDIFLAVSNLAGSQTIQEFWRFTRDMLNFVYILVLLAIAFSTIVGMEQYGMRKLLPKLLYSALLVNFSLLIAGSFIQVANVMCTTALQGLGGDAKCGDPANIDGSAKETPGSTLSLALAQSSLIEKAISIKKDEALIDVFGIKVGSRPGGFEGAMQLTGEGETMLQNNIQVVAEGYVRIVFVGMFCVSLIALALMLGVRVGMLMILLVLAPVPFALGIVPQAESYAKQWWSKFIQYTFFLPVVIFLLVLSIRLVDLGMGTGKEGSKGIFQELIYGNNAGGAGGAGDMLFTFANMFFISLFIVMSIIVAKSMGILGAGAAVGFAKKMTMGTAKGAFMPAKFAAKESAGYLGRKSGVSGLYSGVKQGWASRVAGREAGVNTGLAAQRGAAIFGDGSARAAIYNKAVAENQKDMKGMDDDTLRNKMNSGGAEGAAAAMQLIENESLGKGEKGKNDFNQKILNSIPKTSAARQKYEKAWTKSSPIKAIEAIHAGKDKTERDKLIVEAYSKMKPEDFAKTNAKDFATALAAAKAGGTNILSRAQVEAVAASPNSELAEVVSKKVAAMEREPGFNPQRDSVVAAAKKAGLHK